MNLFEAGVTVVAMVDEDVEAGSPKMNSRFVVDQFRLKPY